MFSVRKSLSVFALSLFLLPSATKAQHYTQKNLVSDVSQPNNADGTKVLVDPNLKNPDDSILTIDGLWSLTFGNDANAGPANTLFFTAGINGERYGLFGTITPVDGLDGDEE